MAVTFNNDFKFINWEAYFSFFQSSVLQTHICDRDNHFLFLFLEGYEKEFRLKKVESSLQFYIMGEKQYDPFCTYRLAEIYNSPSQFNLETNKEKSWFYVLKASVINSLKYNNDFFNAKEKIMTLMAKNGVNMDSCYDLIQKYQHRDTAMVLRYSFMLVYGREQDKSNVYRLLIQEFGELLKNEGAWYLWEYLIGLVSSDIEIKNKDYDGFREIIYKNTENLSKFSTIYAQQLEIMLLLKADDNLIISKMRDYIKHLIIVAKILRFGHEHKDRHILLLEHNLLSCLKITYQQLAKVRILQDRMFFTFHYCQFLYKLNTSPELVLSLVSELQSMMMIKSQLGFLGFFYYLKYKIKADKESLELSKSSFEKEIIENDGENRIVINYYLGRIFKKVRDLEKYQKEMENGYYFYQNNKKEWTELTLKGYYYYLRIRRELKRMHFSLRSNSQFRFPVHYQTVTEKFHLKHLKKQQARTDYKYTDIKVLQILRMQPFQLYLSTVCQKLCTIQKLPLLTSSQLQVLQSEISHLSTIQQQQVLPIITTITQSVDVQEQVYHNVYIVYLPCCTYFPKQFQEAIEECWKLCKGYDYLCRKLGEVSTPIKVYSASGEPGLLGYVGKKEDEQCDLFNEEVFGRLLMEYPIDFIRKYVLKLKGDKLTEIFEQLYFDI